MPKRIITAELDKEIERLGKEGMTASQIGKELNIKYHTVHSHMNEKGMLRKLAKVTNNRTRIGRKQIRVGYFNVHSRENWLA